MMQMQERFLSEVRSTRYCKDGHLHTLFNRLKKYKQNIKNFLPFNSVSFASLSQDPISTSCIWTGEAIYYLGIFDENHRNKP